MNKHIFQTYLTTFYTIHIADFPHVLARDLQLTMLNVKLLLDWWVIK